MITLYIDTETSGLPDMNKRASDPSQPHLVQLAAVMFDCEQEIERFNTLVIPEDWTISPEAAAVHGITAERAKAEGCFEKFAAQIALAMIKDADLVVAHNIQFDKFILRIALRRYGLLTDDMDEWWKGLPTECTMRAMTNICRIPSARGGWKWPRLTEAYKHCFVEEMQGAHDALSDVLACQKVHRWLLAQEGVAP